jgi:hypothetical protein
MSSSSSAGLQHQDSQEAVDAQQPPSIEGARNNKKRKIPAARAGKGTGAKKNATTSVTGKSNKLPSHASVSSANDTPLSLLPEIVLMILDNVSRHTQSIVSSI